MKIGDLVKMKEPKGTKWRTYKSIEKIPGEPGFVIEIAENACKVVFPSLDGDIRSFLKSSLEVVHEQ